MDDAAALARTFDLINRRAAPHEHATDGLRTLGSAELEPPAVRAATQLVAPLAADSPLAAAVLVSAIHEPGMTVVPLDVDLFLSDNEPADRRHFTRLGRFRLRRFESYLIPYLTRRDGEAPETPETARVRWADAIRTHVSKNADALFLYLQWRLNAYRERHPERPDPRQVILVERIFAIAPPDDDTGERWRGPTTLPIARWRPHADVPKDCRPIERYNPVTERFEYVLK